MEPGSLEVVVYRGKELSGNKPDQLPTSSVEIKLGKEVVGTRVVENNRNPQWNTVHRFNKIDISNEKLTLDLTVRDKKDKFTGRVQIPIAQSLNNPAKNFRLEKWFPILNKKLEEDSSITGQIQVKLRFFSAQEERDKEEAKERAKEMVAEEHSKDRNKLMEGKRPAPSSAASKNPFGDASGAAAPIDGVVDSQLQSVVRETDRVRTESKASTNRTLQKLGEAQEIAATTSEKLAHQGDQLNRIADDNYKIEADMKIAARQIRSIKSIFGAMANKFTSSPSGRRKQSKEKQEDTSKDKGDSNSKKAGQVDGQQAFAEPAKKYEEDDIDRDLDQISFGISNLKNIASEMGKEIDSQTKTIDKLIDQTDRNEGLISKFSTKIKKWC